MSEAPCAPHAGTCCNNPAWLRLPKAANTSVTTKVCRFDQHRKSRVVDTYSGEPVQRIGETPMKILCIDDDRDTLSYHKALLERRGYDVLTAASAQEGLKLAEASPIAAVVLDYHMPEMNGHEVAVEIKRIRPEVQIVMVSSDNAIPELALAAVDAFVAKDDAHTHLLPVIAQVCDEVPSLPTST